MVRVACFDYLTFLVAVHAVLYVTLLFVESFIAVQLAMKSSSMKQKSLFGCASPGIVSLLSPSAITDSGLSSSFSIVSLTAGSLVALVRCVAIENFGCVVSCPIKQKTDKAWLEKNAMKYDHATIKILAYQFTW